MVKINRIKKNNTAQVEDIPIHKFFVCGDTLYLRVKDDSNNFPDHITVLAFSSSQPRSTHLTKSATAVPVISYTLEVNIES